MFYKKQFILRWLHRGLGHVCKIVIFYAFLVHHGFFFYCSYLTMEEVNQKMKTEDRCVYMRATNNV